MQNRNSLIFFCFGTGNNSFFASKIIFSLPESSWISSKKSNFLYSSSLVPRGTSKNWSLTVKYVIGTPQKLSTFSVPHALRVGSPERFFRFYALDLRFLCKVMGLLEIEKHHLFFQFFLYRPIYGTTKEVPNGISSGLFI